jgi:hypothetical protein
MAALIVTAGINASTASQAHADAVISHSSPQQFSSEEDDLAGRQNDLLAVVQLLLVAIVMADQSGATTRPGQKR